MAVCSAVSTCGTITPIAPASSGRAIRWSSTLVVPAMGTMPVSFDAMQIVASSGYPGCPCSMSM